MFLLAQTKAPSSACLPLKGYSFRQGKSLAPDPLSPAINLNETGCRLFPALKRAGLFTLPESLSAAQLFFPLFPLCSHPAMLLNPSHLSCWPEELCHRARLATEPSCLATLLSSCVSTWPPSLQTQGQPWRLPVPALVEGTSVELSPGCVLPKFSPAATSSGSEVSLLLPTRHHTTPGISQRTFRPLFLVAVMLVNVPRTGKERGFSTQAIIYGL